MAFAQQPDRDTQVANWEKHLASIIEQTNSNISLLSKSVKSSDHLSHRSSFSHPPPPPPPPPPPLRQSSATFDRDTRARGSHGGLPPRSPDSFTKRSSEYYQQQAREVIESSRGSFGGASCGAGVTRPIPNHVAEDLKRSLLQSVRKSVERIIAEKSQASQSRIDRLNEKCVALTEENAKLHKDHGLLIRSLATQDRLSKRLKQEWDNQRTTIKKLETAIVRDIGWKESTDIDLQMVKDYQREDSAVRVTSAEMSSAMGKIASSVERATTNARNSFSKELALVKKEMQLLKEENRHLKEEISSCSVMNIDFERNAKNVISNAVQCHFDRVEEKITQSVRETWSLDLSNQTKNIDLRIIDALNGNETQDAIARAILERLEDSHTSFSRAVSACLLSSFIDTKTISGKAFDQYLMAQIEKKCDDVKRQLNKEASSVVKEKVGELKGNNQMCNAKIKDIIDEKTEELMKNLDGYTILANSLEPRICSIEKTAAGIQMNASANENTLKNLETKYNILSEDVDAISHISDKLLKENGQSAEKSLNILSDAIDLKIQGCEEKAQASNDSKMKGLSKDIESLKEKIKVAHSLCETMSSSLDIVKGLGSRLDKLEKQSDSSISLESTKGKDDDLRDKFIDSEWFESRFKEEIELSNLATSADYKEIKEQIVLMTQTSNDAMEASSAICLTVCNLKAELEKESKKGRASTEDLASCFGKISALERKVKKEFTKLQENVIQMSSASGERVEYFVDETRNTIIAIKAKQNEQKMAFKDLEDSLKNNVCANISYISTLQSDIDRLKKKILIDGLKKKIQSRSEEPQMKSLVPESIELEKTNNIERQSIINDDKEVEGDKSHSQDLATSPYSMSESIEGSIASFDEVEEVTISHNPPLAEPEEDALRGKNFGTLSPINKEIEGKKAVSDRLNSEIVALAKGTSKQTEQQDGNGDSSAEEQDTKINIMNKNTTTANLEDHKENNTSSSSQLPPIMSHEEIIMDVGIASLPPIPETSFISNQDSDNTSTELQKDQSPEMSSFEDESSQETSHGGGSDLISYDESEKADEYESDFENEDTV